MKLILALLLVLQVALSPGQGSILPSNHHVDDNLVPLPSAAGIRMKVIVKEEEIWSAPAISATINCDYSLTPDSDVPVTITWKIGDGPRFATDVLKCSGYTKASGKCTILEVLDSAYDQRVSIVQDSPSLEIRPVHNADNRNYWCQVSTEQVTNPEMETDMKSVVLRVYGGGDMPKFHSVKIDDDFAANVGASATLGCVCDNSNHCEDVNWFKGPTDATSTSYDLVYIRRTYSKPTPTEYEAFGDWIGRATLQGDSLVISDLRESDAGRYWCELRSSGYYGIGEWATDAKSMVLDVSSSANDFQCMHLADGIYPDSLSCSMYYECIQGKSYHRPCPSGTVLDTGGKVVSCNSPDLVSSACGTKILE